MEYTRVIVLASGVEHLQIYELLIDDAVLVVAICAFPDSVGS
jgi:hypothetical protein